MLHLLTVVNKSLVLIAIQMSTLVLSAHLSYRDCFGVNFSSLSSVTDDIELISNVFSQK